MNNNNRINLGTWKRNLRLYVHVPFCVKKCDYCDFLSGPSNEDGINSYFEALYKEINSYRGKTDDYQVSSVFIGGGTPSCVDSEKIVRTLDELKNVFKLYTNENKAGIKPEITIEVNPGTVEINSTGIDRKKFMDYKNAGINRISFGLQSIHDHELMLLGRIHTYSQFEENYYLAREIGFNNINIDLMSALPGQSIKTWEETLIKTASLRPEHISAYSLIIEEGTPFYDMYGPEGTHKNRLPSEDIEREIYTRTKDILSSFGYERYEISNYALKGYQCRHNLAYWEPENYLGFGLGSASYIDNIRFHNTYDLNEYISKIHKKDLNNISTVLSEEKHYSLINDTFGIRKDITSLSKKQQMEEYMFLGLRKTEGVSKHIFYEKFGVTIDDIYKDVLKTLEDQGLIYINNDRIWLTNYGIDVSNRVMAEFFID